jgi:distribution and morphology protein 12
MSIDLNWEKVTEGPDGKALEQSIRDFIHQRFQTVTLPRFIKSVKVHAFEFGSVAPEIELKDICDPLPDFYEDEGDDEDEDEPETVENAGWQPRSESPEARTIRDRRRTDREAGSVGSPSGNDSAVMIDTRAAISRPLQASGEQGSGFFGTYTPGISGGTSNLNYFHSHLATGFSGTQTPLAAVAGAHLPHGWPDYSTQSATKRAEHDLSGSATSQSPPSTAGAAAQKHVERGSVSTFSPPESRPPTQDGLGNDAATEDDDSPQKRFHERRVEDLQTVFRVRYSGDIRLSLTAEILLDYPMPSFVGIPLKLNITGLSFDGVAVLAYIRKKAHFCFLSHEDALNAIGPEDLDDPAGNSSGLKMGGLLQEIKVESEIGQRDNGRQVLKNVGKVEKFVLEQVRRIFEDEFVYPSFWTFLV